MSALVISEVEIIDEAAANEYRVRAASSIRAYGGKYLARGAEAVVAEGASATGRFVVCEFPSLQRIEEWYSSPEYAEALKFRDAALRRRLIFVDGVAQEVREG